MALFLLLQSLAFFSNNFLCVSGTVLEFFILQLVLCDSPNRHMNSCFLSAVLSTPSHHPLCCTSAVVPHTPCLLPTLFPQHHVPFHGAFLPTYISFPLLTNYHKLHNLKQHTFMMISQFPWVKGWAQLIWALCTRSLKATVMVSTGLYSHPEAWLGKNPLPSSPRLLADFVTLWPPDWRPWIFAGCQLTATLSSEMPPVVPRDCLHTTFSSLLHWLSQCMHSC